MKRAETIFRIDKMPKPITAIQKPTSDKRLLPRMGESNDVSQSRMDAEGDTVYSFSIRGVLALFSLCFCFGIDCV